MQRTSWTKASVLRLTWSLMKAKSCSVGPTEPSVRPHLFWHYRQKCAVYISKHFPSLWSKTLPGLMRLSVLDFLLSFPTVADIHFLTCRDKSGLLNRVDSQTSTWIRRTKVVDTRRHRKSMKYGIHTLHHTLIPLPNTWSVCNLFIPTHKHTDIFTRYIVSVSSVPNVTICSTLYFFYA